MEKRFLKEKETDIFSVFFYFFTKSFIIQLYFCLINRRLFIKTNININILVGNIANQKTDAVVNSANNTLLGGYGIDKAIHDAAGPELLKECKQIGFCATGDAVITNGYNLPNKYVIHTVGPVWCGGYEGESNILYDCYTKSINLAAEKGCRSIALPTIAIGEYDYPIQEAALITMYAITTNHHVINEDISVTFVCYTDDICEIYKNALKEIKEEKIKEIFNRKNGIEISIDLSKDLYKKIKKEKYNKNILVYNLFFDYISDYFPDCVCLKKLTSEITIDDCLSVGKRGPFVAADCIKEIKIEKVSGNRKIKLLIKPFVYKG